MGTAVVLNPWRVNDNQIQYQNTILPKVVELMKKAFVPSDVSFISPLYVGDISLLQALIIINTIPGSGTKTSYYDEKIHIPYFNGSVARLAVNKLGCIVPILDRDYKALSKKGTTLVAIQISVTDRAVVLSQGDIKRFPEDENVFVTLPDAVRAGINSTLTCELNLMRVSLDWISIVLTYLQSDLELPMDGIWISTDKTLRTKVDVSKRINLNRVPDVPWKEIFPSAIDDETDDTTVTETDDSDESATVDENDEEEKDDIPEPRNEKHDNATDDSGEKKQFLEELFSGSQIKASVISSALALATAVLSDVNSDQDENSNNSHRDTDVDRRNSSQSTQPTINGVTPSYSAERIHDSDNKRWTVDNGSDSNYGELRTNADFDLFFFS